MGNTAIVIGATGLVGRALLDQLVMADHIARIVTLTRRPAAHDSAKINNQLVEFDHLEDHAKLFHADMLISCLGTTRKQAGSLTAQRKVDIDYQYKAAQLAAENGVGHYLLVSSSGADANSNSPYLKMKGELEDKISKLPFSRISIFQPSLLLGPRDGFRATEKLASWFLPPLCSIPGLRKFRPITGSEVAEKLVQVSKQPGSSRERFRLDEIFVR